MSTRYDRAICVGVDRVAGKCLVQWPVPDGVDIQPEVIPVVWRGNDPPAPLTYVNMEEVSSGSWVCTGTTANVETRLIEDWDSVSADGTTFVASGSTSWLIDSDMGSPAANVNYAANEYGSMRMGTSGISGEYNGVNKPGADHADDGGRDTAWWLEVKCMVEQTTSRSFGAGLAAYGFDPFPAGGSSLLVLSETATLSGQLRLRADDGAQSEIAMGFTPTVNVPFIVHLMVMGTEWAAAWVVESSTAAQDLDTTVHGPFVVTANITTSMGPAFYLKTGAAATKHAQCDYFRVSTVRPVLHPSEVLSG